MLLAESELDEAAFAVVVCNFNSMEVLQLNYEGHIRVLYSWDKYNEMSISNLVA